MENCSRNFNYDFKNIAAIKRSPAKTGSPNYVRFCISGLSLLIVSLITSQVVAAGNPDIQNLDPVALLETALEPNRQPKTPVYTAGAVNSFDAIIEKAQANASDIRHLWQNTLTVPDDTPAESTTSIQESSTDMRNLPTEFKQQLRQARIGAPPDTNDTQTTQLQQIIQQLISVEFKASQMLPKPLITLDAAPTANALEVSPDTPAQPETPHAAQPQLPPSLITEQTLQKLKIASEHPEQLKNPLELAEILFNNGHLPQAANCYQQALKRIPPNEVDRFQNKAWLLFQIGNCLQKSDPQTAMQMYRQLITEYPSSPWADSAKIKTKLIDWHLNDKPETFLNTEKS